MTLNINSDNRTSFKNWIKASKEAFGQQIITDYVGVVTSLQTSSVAGENAKT